MENKTLGNALQALNHHHLADAIACVRQFLGENAFLYLNNELERIEADYNLMLNYMSRGFTDPARDDIYRNLLLRMYRCIRNYNMAYLRKMYPVGFGIICYRHCHAFFRTRRDQT